MLLGLGEQSLAACDFLFFSPRPQQKPQPQQPQQPEQPEQPEQKVRETSSGAWVPR